MLPEIYGFGGATLALTLFTYPYVFVTVRGALLRLDPAFEQASRSLGAGPWTTLMRVTVPLLRPSIAAGCLLVALYTLSDFGAVSLLQFDSLSRAIYLQYQGSLDRSGAALLALLLVALSAAIVLAEGASRGRARYYRFARTTAPPGRSPLGRWKAPALVFCASTVLLAVVLPVAVLLYWLARGIGAGSVRLDSFWLPVLNSGFAAGSAAAVALLAAIPVAVLAVRHPGSLSTAVERITYGSFALPGIVVALVPGVLRRQLRAGCSTRRWPCWSSPT